MSDLPLTERGRLLSELASTSATLPTGRDQTWRLGEAMRLMLRADGVAITLEYLSDNRVTLCASDEVAAASRAFKRSSDRAPGTRRPNDVVVVAGLDGDADQRWPMLAQTLESKFGPLRVYAVPVHANGRFSAESRRSTTRHPATGRAG